MSITNMRKNTTRFLKSKDGFMNQEAIANRIASKMVKAADPSVAVYNYLMKNSDEDVKDMKKLIEGIESELKEIRKQLKGLDALGSGVMESQSFLPRLVAVIKPLNTLSGNILKNAEKFQ